MSTNNKTGFPFVILCEAKDILNSVQCIVFSVQGRWRVVFGF